MSGRMSGRMSVERARRLADGGVHTVHGGQVIPAARTIVDQADRIEKLNGELSAVAAHSLAQGKKLRAQAEQIKRLQKAVVRVARMSGWPDHAYRTVLALHPGDLGEDA